MGSLNWSAPKIWPDSKVYIIGGGPSLSEMDLTPIHSQRVIGVNNAFELGDWVDCCYFGDSRWYDWNKDALKNFGGLKVTSFGREVSCRKGLPGIHKISREHTLGISKKNNVIFWNRSSGASAINLAYHFGAKIIVLLGFDMKMKGDMHNWHSQHKRFHIPPNDIYSNRFIKVFGKISKDANTLGITILNATPDSAITNFKMVSLEESLCYQN